ncbi:uncharacterized protein [Halyomorpha halys]|uniref:uncharacterized protein n=1 Tax=Halyomorpha halys TaxID=286706 RepID=UPI0006D51D94|nr:uncharacterized protein LOC106687330 [Halyomorpha halys]
MKEDQEYNIRFVKSVERHRCVYDFTLVDYSNRERQEKAWQEIANEMSSSVSDCKERWRNLRGCLTRHLKRNGDSSRSKKPYYLTEHMQFVVPFTKTRSRAVLPFIQDGLDDFFTTGELGSKLAEKDDLEEDFDLLGEPTVESSLSPLPVQQQIIRKRANSPEDSEESNLDYYKSKRLKEETELADPDMNFFVSLLPDVRSMNPAQKRKMKIGLLKLIDEILV